VNGLFETLAVQIHKTVTWMWQCEAQFVLCKDVQDLWTCVEQDAQETTWTWVFVRSFGYGEIGRFVGLQVI